MCHSNGPAPDGTPCASGKVEFTLVLEIKFNILIKKQKILKACLAGTCTDSSAVQQSACIFGDDVVVANYVTASTYQVSCPDYRNLVSQAGLSFLGFCLSTTGQTKCCQTCQSSF